MLKNIIKRWVTPFWILLSMTGMGVGAFLIGTVLEVYGHFPACILCHTERFLFLIGGAISFLTWIWRKEILGQLLCIALGLVWSVGSGVGFYHAGIQYHLFDKPSFCHVQEVAGDSLDSQLANFLAEPSASCDQRTLDIFSIPASLYIGFALLFCVGWTVFCFRKMHHGRLFL